MIGIQKTGLGFWVQDSSFRFHDPAWKAAPSAARVVPGHSLEIHDLYEQYNEAQIKKQYSCNKKAIKLK